MGRTTSELCFPRRRVLDGRVDVSGSEISRGGELSLCTDCSIAPINDAMQCHAMLCNAMLCLIYWLIR